jgi:uncharacterized protein (DUF2236 family)
MNSLLNLLRLSNNPIKVLKRFFLIFALIVYIKDCFEVYKVLTLFRTKYEEFPRHNGEEDLRILSEYEEHDKNLVSDAEFEEILNELDKELGESNLGLFQDKNDPAIEVLGELAAGFNATRAVALQIAHPFIARGIILHSNVQTNPYDRAVKTQLYTLGMFWGTKKEIMKSARIVRSLHRKVKGEIGEETSIFTSTSPFDAAQRDAIRWVACTMPETVDFGMKLLKREMTSEEKVALLKLNNRFMKCFGISSTKYPTTWEGYQEYYEAMMRSKLLSTSEASFEIIDTLSIPSYPILAPLNRLLSWQTYITLPPRLGESFYGRRYTEFDLIMYSLLVGWNRFLYRLLPDWLRCLTAYHTLKLRAGTDKHWEITRWFIQRLGEFGNYAIYLFLGAGTKREKEMIQRIMMEKKQARKERLERERILVK